MSVLPLERSASSANSQLLRRRRLVVEGFHARFVITQLLWLTLALVLLSFALFMPLVAALLNTTASDNALELADRFLSLHRLVWPLFIGFFLVSGVIVVLTTHRIAGPLYRFRRTFGEVGRGDLTVAMTTRDGDYLAQEAAELDGMLASLRDRIGRAKHDTALAEDEAERLVTQISQPTHSELRALVDRIASARRVLDEFTTERRGFTIVELVVKLAVLTAIIAIALPFYFRALSTARTTRTIADLRTIDRLAQLHRAESGCLPASLGDIEFVNADPWGRPYVYQPIRTGANASSCTACADICIEPGDARTDKDHDPLNSDFDAYSIGPDGETASPLDAEASEDDIVRAADGGFYGVGRDY